MFRAKLNVKKKEKRIDSPLVRLASIRFLRIRIIFILFFFFLKPTLEFSLWISLEFGSFFQIGANIVVVVVVVFYLFIYFNFDAQTMHLILDFEWRVCVFLFKYIILIILFMMKYFFFSFVFRMKFVFSCNLCRYNELEQPVCRVCDIILKSESHWDSHQVSHNIDM